MIDLLIGGAIGFLAWCLVPLFLYEIAARRGTVPALHAWTESAPRLGGVSLLGWAQLAFVLIGAVIAKAVS